MDAHQTAAHFLACVRREFQWVENHQVLPQGDTTPYLDRVARFSAGILGTQLNKVQVLVFPRRSMSDWKGATWALKIEDTMHTLDGSEPLETFLARIEAERQQRLGGQADLLSFSTPDAGALLVATHDEYAQRDLHRMEGLWAVEIQAKQLESKTPAAAPARVGPRL